MAAINADLRYRKNIFLRCEKCVRTRKADLVVLRAVSKVTASWCWFLLNRLK